MNQYKAVDEGGEGDDRYCLETKALTGGGRLSRVDVADDHDVDVSLILLTADKLV
jgi:hypothetical protein